MKLVILAAGSSNRFNKTIKHKSQLKIRNKTLIQHIVKNLSTIDEIKKIEVVLGKNASIIKKNLKSYKCNFLINKDYHNTEMLYSLYLSLKNCHSDVLVVYSDIFFDKKIIIDLLIKTKKNKNSIMLPVLSNWKKIWKQRNKLHINDAEEILIDKDYNLQKIGKKIKNILNIKYQYMGILFLPKSIISNFKKNIEINKKTQITEYLNFLVKKKINIKCLTTNHHWYEFDDMQDYKSYKFHHDN